MWLPGCRLRLGLGGAAACDARVAGVEVTRDWRSASNSVHSRVGPIRTFLFSFSSFCWDRAHWHFGRFFSSFPIHPLHIPSRTERGELLGAVVWPRGWTGIVDRGRQALARDLTSALDLPASTSNLPRRRDLANKFQDIMVSCPSKVIVFLAVRQGIVEEMEMICKSDHYATTGSLKVDSNIKTYIEDVLVER